MRTKPPSNRRKTWLLATAFVFFVLCLLIIAWLFLFQSQRESLVISINSPQNGDTFGLNDLIPVSTSGYLTEGVQRIELYVDGALTGEQDTTLPQGSNPLMLNVDWLPQTPGRHLLMARAYAMDGTFADSATVMVDILPAPETLLFELAPMRDPGSGTCPSLAQISASSGISIERLLELNPTLVGRGTDAPLACEINLTAPTIPPGGGTSGGGPGSTGSSPTPGGGSGPTGPGGPPPAPRPGSPAVPAGLGGTLTCTEATLNWSASPDASNGYAVYYLAPGMRTFQRIPPSGSATTARVPITAPGSYRFQVAAVRGGQEGLSAIVTLNTPDLCTPPAIVGAPTDITLSLITLTTPEAYDGVYCYARVMDMPDQRLPRADFSSMRPGTDGMTYSIQRQLPNRGQFRLAVPSDGAVNLRMECWGYRGAESISLGSFTSSHGSSEWDGRDLTQITMNPTAREMASLEGEGGISPLAIGPNSFQVIYRIGASTTSSLPSLMDPSLVPLLTPGMLQPIEATLNIPAPTNVRIRNIPGSLGLNVWSGELQWDWSGAPLLNESTITGYQVRIYAQDEATGRLGGSPVPIWQSDVTPGSRKWISLPRLPAVFGCGFRLVYEVTAMAGPFSSPPAILSSRSEPCRASAILRVTLVSLRLTGILDRGDFCFIFCGDDLRLELFGWIGVHDQRATILKSLNPNDTCGYEATDGELRFHQMYLLRTSTDPTWGRSWGMLQHEFRVHVLNPTQTVRINVHISDHDPAPFMPCHVGSDRVMGFNLELPALEIVEWQRFQQTVTRSGRIEELFGPDVGINQGSAAITIHII